MQRLDTLWLVCAAVGFVLLASVAFALAMVIDGPGQPRPASVASKPVSTQLH